MATIVIFIEHGDTSNGSLRLSDRGRTRARRTDKIIWQIRAHSGVHAITDIREKKDSEDIWSVEPRRQGNHWEGDISPTARIHAIYRYAIDWKATESGPVHTHDPIISIRPSTVVDTVVGIAVFLSAAILGFFAMKFLVRKKSRK